jgi:uncharacterized protein YbbC (DUF1343 family)
MTILPTDIRILFTNYDIIAYFLNLAFCSEHFISIEHRRGNQEWTIQRHWQQDEEKQSKDRTQHVLDTIMRKKHK